MSSFAPEDTNAYHNGEADLEFSDTNLVPPAQQNVQNVDRVRRTSNMFIAAAYNITAIIGVGVLGLPHAMVFLTWGPGVVVLLLALFITYFTMNQLIKLHEFEFVNPHDKKETRTKAPIPRLIRYSTYHVLWQRAFPEWGLWIVMSLQMTVEVSLDILFTVAAGEAMNRIHDNVTKCNPVHLFVWFAVFATIQIVLSVLLFPTFESLKWIAVAAAVMSICYSTIAWITVVSQGGPENPNYGLPMNQTVDYCAKDSDLALSDADRVFQVFNAIGVVAFAYAAHNVVLEIQNGIPSTPEKPSQKEMLRAVWITYAVVALCYVPMGIAVYAIHGNEISQNVLSFMQYHIKGAPRGLVVAVNMMLILHLIGSYQIFALPVFKLLETWFIRSFAKKNSNLEGLRKSSPLRVIQIAPYIIRPLYIVLTTTLAMLFPYFSPLLGFFGGLAIAPTTYFLPCIMWLWINKPVKWKSKDWYLNWAFIVLGVILMIFASMGGLIILIKTFSNNGYDLWTSNWRNSTLYHTYKKCNSC